MRVNHVLRAQSLRFVHRKRDIYIPNVVRLLQERYGFVRVPTRTKEVLPPQGPVLFEHGRLAVEGREIFIEAVKLFETLILVETLTSTDDADIVLADMLRNGADLVEPADSRHHYANQLEVAFGTTPLEWISPVINDTMMQLSRWLAHYDPNVPSDAMVPGFYISGLQINVDPRQFLIACDFRLERRANVPYTENIYFAQAPLRTQDHITLLERFEAKILERTRPE